MKLFVGLVACLLVATSLGAYEFKECTHIVHPDENAGVQCDPLPPFEKAECENSVSSAPCNTAKDPAGCVCSAIIAAQYERDADLPTHEDPEVGAHPDPEEVGHGHGHGHEEVGHGHEEVEHGHELPDALQGTVEEGLPAAEPHLTTTAAPADAFENSVSDEPVHHGHDESGRDEEEPESFFPFGAPEDEESAEESSSAMTTDKAHSAIVLRFETLVKEFEHFQQMAAKVVDGMAVDDDLQQFKGRYNILVAQIKQLVEQRLRGPQREAAKNRKERSSMKHKVSKLVTRVGTLQTTTAKLAGDFATERRKLVELDDLLRKNDKCNELQEKVKGAEKQCEASETALKESEANIASLNEELERLKLEEKLHREVDTVDFTNVYLRNDIRHGGYHHLTSHKKFDDEGSAVKEFQDRIATLRRGESPDEPPVLLQVASKARDWAEQQERLQKVLEALFVEPKAADEYDAIQKNIQAQLQAEVESFVHDVFATLQKTAVTRLHDSKTAELKHLKALVEKHSESLERLPGHIADLEQEAAVFAAEVEGLKAQREKLQAERDQLMQVLKAGKMTHFSVEELAAQLRLSGCIAVGVGDTASRLGIANVDQLIDQKLAELLKNADDLKEQFDKAQRHIEEAAKEAEHLERSIEHIKPYHADAKARTDHLELDVQALQEHLQKLLSDLAELEAAGRAKIKDHFSGEDLLKSARQQLAARTRLRTPPLLQL